MGGMQPQMRKQEGDQVVRANAPARTRPADAPPPSKTITVKPVPDQLDRRSPSPRRPQSNRSKVEPRDESNKRRHVVPSSWWFMAMAIASGLPLGALLTQSLPTKEILLCYVAAVIAALLTAIALFLAASAVTGGVPSVGEAGEVKFAL